MSQNAPQHFFISYNKADRTWAEWNAWHLEEAGYTTIIQAWDFRPGMNFVQKMHEAAQEAERTIAVLSTNYLEALYTYPEWEAALQQDPRGEKGVLVPVRIQECKPPGLLGLLSYIDLVGLDESAAQDRLLDGVRQERNKPLTAPLYPGTLHEAQRTVPEQPGFPGAFPPIWNVPYTRNPYFTGRDTILHQLHAALSKESATAITQGQAISGLGGIGKTQTAVEYTYRYRSGYRAIFWVRAETEVELQTGFGAIATLLGLPEQKATNPSDTAQAVKHWLERNTGWLLVFDNADAPVEQLAAELGYLPLALEQAAAYIRATAASFQAYLASFQRQRLSLLNKANPKLGNYPASVAKTWALNFQQVERDPFAADVLRVSAFLSPDAIPLELLTEGASQLGPVLAKALASDDPLVLNEALEPLTRYSLIRFTVETGTYSIHRMVQEVLKVQIGSEQRSLWAERVVRAVEQSFPEVNYQTWTRCERLIPHALVCADHIDHWKMTLWEAQNLLSQTGNYLYQRGQYWEAEPLWKMNLAICEQALGPEHPNTLSSLNSPGLLYWKQGKYEQAEPLYQRALSTYEQAMGADHPETIRVRNNYALLQEQMKQKSEVARSKPKPARKRGGK